MSGLEILGGVSAASVLAEQGGKLIKFTCDIYSKYQRPEETQRQLVQIQQVRVTQIISTMTVPSWY